MCMCVSQVGAMKMETPIPWKGERLGALQCSMWRLVCGGRVRELGVESSGNHEPTQTSRPSGVEGVRASAQQRTSLQSCHAPKIMPQIVQPIDERGHRHLPQHNNRSHQYWI